MKVCGRINTGYARVLLCCAWIKPKLCPNIACVGSNVMPRNAKQGDARHLSTTASERFYSILCITWVRSNVMPHCTMGQAQCKMGNRKMSTSPLILRGNVTFTF